MEFISRNSLYFTLLGPMPVYMYVCRDGYHVHISVHKCDLHCRYYLAKTLTYTYNTNICLYEDVQSCIYMILKKKG